MKRSCSNIARAFAQRQSGIIRHRAPSIPNSLAYSIRWSTSSADQTVTDAPPTSQSSGIKEASPTAKGKQKAEDPVTKSRKDMIRDILFESQSNIEESQQWKESNTRYPGLKSKQVNLVAVLKEVIAKTNKIKERLSARELLLAHSTILKADRHAQSTFERDRRFQTSSVAYTEMLKYAHRLRDGNALRIIAKEAITWKHLQSRGKPLEARRKRFIHPRVAAADELSRLARNLFVSLTVQKQWVSDGKQSLMPGLHLPSGLTTTERGDDAMTITSMLRQRLGGFKMSKREEDGESYIKLAKDAQSSRVPMIHQSRKIRWVNRMAERGLLSKIALRTDRSEKTATNGDTPESSQTPVKEASLPVLSHPVKGPPAPPPKPSVEYRIETIAGGSEMIDFLSSPCSDQARVLQMQALRNSYVKWQSELSRRMTSRKQIAQVVRQFMVRPNVMSVDTIEAIKRLVPSWLILAVLRLQIEAGDPKRAEKVVEVYIKSLQDVYEDQTLIDIIPIDKNRVHSITSPFIPPNGSSFLNGILRAHLVSGAGDCFNKMLLVVDKWAVEGYKFSRTVTQQKTKSESTSLGSCFVPNDATLMILLQALKSRNNNFSLGVKTIEEMWRRWGTVGVRKEREDFLEPQKHQTLKLPIQAFTTLLRWALTEKKTSIRRRKVERILNMEQEWREKVFDGNKNWLGAAIEDKISWDRMKKKAENKLPKEKEGKEEAQEEEEECKTPPLYFTTNQ